MINKIKAEIEELKIDYTTSRKREIEKYLNKCLKWAEELEKELKTKRFVNPKVSDTDFIIFWKNIKKEFHGEKLR